MRTADPAPVTELPRLGVGVLWAIGMAPITLWVGMFWLSGSHPEMFSSLTVEDGLFEYGQVVLYLVATLLGVQVMRRLGRFRWRWAVGFGVLALGLLGLAGEEISWGQRLFDIRVPSWFREYNLQKEMTLHNLPVPEWGRGTSTPINLAKPMKHALDLTMVCAIGASLLVQRLGRRRLAAWRTELWVSHPSLIPSWVCVLSYFPLRWVYFTQHPDATGVPRAIQRMSEVSELALAFGITVFLLMVLQSLPRGSRA